MLFAIIHLSLYPFQDWTLRRPHMFSWLLNGLPRFYSLGDLVVNVLAYAGFGYVTVRWLRHWQRTVPALLLASLISILLSFSMESLQSYLPRRVPSLIDLVTNGGGGILGALAAIMVERSPRLLRWQKQLAAVLPDASSERSHQWLAFALAGAWVLGQFTPQQLLLVNAPLTPWPGQSLLPSLMPAGQLSGFTLVVSTHFLPAASLALLGLILIRCARTQPVARRTLLLLLGVLAAMACIQRLSSSTLVYGTDPAGWMRWVPWLALPLGLALLLTLMRAPARLQAGVAVLLAALSMGVALLMPTDPAFTDLALRRTSWLMRWSTPGFRSLVRVVSAFWPLAVVYFFAKEVANSSGKQPQSAVEPPSVGGQFRE